MVYRALLRVRNSPSPGPAKRQAKKSKRTTKLFLTFAIIAAGLAGRSAVDKVLAQRGGAELVALWAQLSSVIDLVTSVALSGVGAGLSVLVAQIRSPERQQLLLPRALYLGLAVSLPAGVVVGAAGWRFSDVLGGAALSPPSVALAGLAGWIAVIHGTVNSFWLGQQRRDLMLGLAAVSAALTFAAASFAPQAWLMELIIVSQAAPALVLLFVPRKAQVPKRADDHALQRYIVPGLVIGILSPASMLFARSQVADSLSWHESGVLQALWRVSDWICGFAAGVISVLYFPKFAAAYHQRGLAFVLREAVRTVLLPSAAFFLLLFAFHRPLLAVLYDPSFEVSPIAVALIFAGSLVRIASWIALYALYAAVRTRAIAIGEFLSLPLFAVLVFAAGESLTLELVGALWLATYLAYGAFNFWAIRKA